MSSKSRCGSVSTAVSLVVPIFLSNWMEYLMRLTSGICMLESATPGDMLGDRCESCAKLTPRLDGVPVWSSLGVALRSSAASDMCICLPLGDSGDFLDFFLDELRDSDGES